jgi:hypothetical protein
VPQMTSLVRPADIEKERTTLTEFLSEYLSPDANSARYEWLYCKNPHGRARAWVASGPDEQKVIGFAAAFPRRMQFEGKTIRGYVLGDFCIHPAHRSLGPALALQRMSMEALSDEGAEFVFDFPSTSMLAIYKRLGIGISGTMIRFAKPLRANRLLQQRIRNKVAARGLAAAANIALRLGDASLSSGSSWTINSETNPCGEEFTVAAREWSHRMGLCTARTAEYLNWRYLQHPQQHYQLLTARKQGKLCGFMILTLTEDDGTVADVLGQEDAVCRALLVESIAISRSRGINTLSAPFFSSHGGRKLLEDCGFRPREASPVIVLKLPGMVNRRALEDSHRWYLMHGDRES